MKTKNMQTLAKLITELRRPKPVTLDSVASRSKSILGPLAATGYVVELDAESYHWFFDLRPPHFVGRDYFLFGEGMEPFRLFFVSDKRHFVRRLTWDQTREICYSAGIPIPRCR